MRLYSAYPAESPLWDWSDLWRVLKEGLCLVARDGKPYTSDRILFVGGFGDRIGAS
ncbi:MAG: hypothetical protein LBJ62_00105 [Bifidobacteriaceae bacterium]|nr:hypothetical protein [Bifidobacteriaceae bacterium]